MSSLGIIPARYNSTRFPGKPLMEINGKPMVLHVFDAAKQSKLLNEVIIATDDERIFYAAKEHGAKAVMTSKNHTNGTERCAEVVNNLMVKPEIVLNIQGDEPFIKPQQLDALIEVMRAKNAEIGTMVKLLDDETEITNPNVVKVALNNDGRVIYFSRAVIPYNRSGSAKYFKHLGLYAYKTKILQEIVDLQPDALEQTESLEQLRWLAHGYTIFTAKTNLDTIAVDTPEDLERIKRLHA